MKGPVRVLTGPFILVASLSLALWTGSMAERWMARTASKGHACSYYRLRASDCEPSRSPGACGEFHNLIWPPCSIRGLVEVSASCYLAVMPAGRFNSLVANLAMTKCPKAGTSDMFERYFIECGLESCPNMPQMGDLHVCFCAWMDYLQLWRHSLP